jgi:hypothetical protein
VGKQKRSEEGVGCNVQLVFVVRDNYETLENGFDAISPGGRGNAVQKKQ